MINNIVETYNEATTIPEIKAILNSEVKDNELLAIKFIKFLDKNDFITNNTEAFNRILNNLIIFISKDNNTIEAIIESIYQNASKVNEYISRDKLFKLFKESFDTDEFRDLATTISNELLNLSKEDLMNATTFKQLINVVIVKLINSSSYDKVYAFIKKAISFNESKDLVLSALDKIPGVVPPVFTSEQITDVINSLTESEAIKYIVKSFIKDGLFNQNITRFDQLNNFSLILKS
ncbi:UNVERIFIED_CONTAM: hypothetical protein O8I53_08045 [Campylobacter lari]